MRVLVDTSVWSLALRRDKTVQSPDVLELRRLITAHLVEIIGPIRQEVLSGIRDTIQFDRLERYLAAFSDLSLHSDDYANAAKFFNLCRGKGIQGSNTDFLICAVAVRHDLAIFTTDLDFMHFAKSLPIILHERKPKNYACYN
jgi:predicted nucleic acid-binding protein